MTGTTSITAFNYSSYTSYHTASKMKRLNFYDMYAGLIIEEHNKCISQQ